MTKGDDKTFRFTADELRELVESATKEAHEATLTTAYEIAAQTLEHYADEVDGASIDMDSEEARIAAERALSAATNEARLAARRLRAMLEQNKVLDEVRALRDEVRRLCFTLGQGKGASLAK